VSDDERPFDPVQTLTNYAEHLNAICKPAWWPRVFYDAMSGALIWSDETNRQTPVEVIWALRFVVAYRTSLMLDEPQAEHESMWRLGLSLFPNWVGFRPERRQATPKLLAIYRRGNGELSDFIRDIERQLDEEDRA
jgi:hypothetical protein